MPDELKLGEDGYVSLGIVTTRKTAVELHTCMKCGAVIPSMRDATEQLTLHTIWHKAHGT
ncbi:MAG TPA: hypothetical protein VN843_25740 [Anaerolineales bacterium]|nr:hypothetical protein [Anaerolineales bacterium]